MRLIAVPLASKIHGKEHYEKILREFRSALEESGIDVLEALDGDLSDEIVEKVKEAIPIVIVLTGGTSDLAMKLLERGEAKRAILLSHSKHNSLASAISIKSRAKGIAIKNYFEAVDRAVKIGKALKELLGIKVGAISNGIDARRFEEVLNAKVLRFDYETLDTSGMNVDEALYSISKRIEIPENDAARKAIEIYLAMKKLAIENQLKALTIDCFPYLIRHGITPCIAVSLLNDDGIITACEADLRSLMLMLMARALGRTPWMANIASVNGKRLTIAHCTIATKLGVNCKLSLHFESGLPYSLTCRLKEGEYTLTGINRDCSLMAALKVKLIDSGLINEEMCRTQALLEADVDLSDFPNMALGNHHVLIPGDVAKDLKDLAELLSIKFVDYEKLL